MAANHTQGFAGPDPEDPRPRPEDPSKEDSANADSGEKPCDPSHCFPDPYLDELPREMAIVSAAESRALYPAADHGAAKHSTGEHGTGEHGTSKHGTSKHNTGEHGTSEHGTGEHNTGEHSTGEHSTGEHSTDKNRTDNHRADKHSPVKIWANKERPAHIAEWLANLERDGYPQDDPSKENLSETDSGYTPYNPKYCFPDTYVAVLPRKMAIASDEEARAMELAGMAADNHRTATRSTREPSNVAQWLADLEPIDALPEDPVNAESGEHSAAEQNAVNVAQWLADLEPIDARPEDPVKADSGKHKAGKQRAVNLAQWLADPEPTDALPEDPVKPDSGKHRAGKQRAVNLAQWLADPEPTGARPEKHVEADSGKHKAGKQRAVNLAQWLADPEPIDTRPEKHVEADSGLTPYDPEYYFTSSFLGRFRKDNHNTGKHNTAIHGAAEKSTANKSTADKSTAEKNSSNHEAAYDGAADKNTADKSTADKIIADKGTSDHEPTYDGAADKSTDKNASNLAQWLADLDQIDARPEHRFEAHSGLTPYDPNYYFSRSFTKELRENMHRPATASTANRAERLPERVGDSEEMYYDPKEHSSSFWEENPYENISRSATPSSTGDRAAFTAMNIEELLACVSPLARSLGAAVRLFEAASAITSADPQAQISDLASLLPCARIQFAPLQANNRKFRSMDPFDEGLMDRWVDHYDVRGYSSPDKEVMTETLLDVVIDLENQYYSICASNPEFFEEPTEYRTIVTPKADYEELDDIDSIFIGRLQALDEKAEGSFGWGCVCLGGVPSRFEVGAFIATDTSEKCPGTSIYATEITALALLMAHQLYDGPYRNQTAALVINITQTSIRAVQGVIFDDEGTIRPHIDFSVLEEVPHNLEGHPESHPAHEWTDCPGCRKALAWLRFSPEPVYPQPPSTIQRCVNGSWVFR